MLPGTVRYDAVKQASLTNARMYGAIGAFERFILPKIWEKDEDARNGVALEFNVIYNAAQAFGQCSALGVDCPEGVTINQVDLYASNLAFVFSLDESLGMFYSSSYTVAAVPGTSDSRMVSSIMVTGAPLFAYVFGPVRLLGKDTFNKILPGDADGIVGGFVRTDSAALYAGYLFSKGAFTNVGLPELKAFASAAFAREFSELSYLKTGLERLELGGEDVAETIGKTTAFVRRLRMYPPTPNPQGIPIEELEPLDGFDFLTAHLDQTAIADYFGGGAALGIKPNVSMFEGHLQIQTKDFRSAATGAFGDPTEAPEFNGCLKLGFVQMPNLYYYGVEGGRHFMVSAEANVHGVMALIFRMNDPELLSAFPYAHDAVNFAFRGGF